MGLKTVRAWAERKLAAVGMFVVAALLWAMTATCANATVNASISTAPSNPNPDGVNSATIYPGDVVHVRVVGTNSDVANAVTGVEFTITMPPEALTLGGGTAGVVIVDAGGGSGVVSYKCRTEPLNPATETNGVGTLTAVPGTSTFSLTGGVIPAATGPLGVASECYYDIAVTSRTVSTDATSGPVTIGANQFETDAGNAPASNLTQTISVRPFQRPTITKSFSPSTATVGTAVQLTVTITNPSTNAALPLNTGSDAIPYAFRDNLSTYGLQVAPTPNPQVNCTGGSTAPTFTATAGANFIQATGGSIAPTRQCVFTVNVVATQTGAPLTNIINRTTEFGNKRGLAAVGNATADLTSTSSLQVTTQFDTTPLGELTASVLRISITNAGGVALTQQGTWTSLIDTVDDQTEDYFQKYLAKGLVNFNANNGIYPGKGLVITGPPTTNGQCGGGVVGTASNDEAVTLTGAVFSPGQTCTINVPFEARFYRSTDSSGWNWTHLIESGEIDVSPDVESQRASALVNIVGRFNVDKFVISTDTSGGYDNSYNPPRLIGVAGPGGIIHYRLTVGNFGGVTDIVITDRGLAANNWTMLNGGGYTPEIDGPGCGTLVVGGSAAEPTFTIPSMPAGTGNAPARCDIDFYVQTDPNAAVTGTQLTNCLERTDSLAENGTIEANNRSCGGIFYRENLVVSESFTPTSAAVGQTSKLTVTFTNIGSSALTGLSLTNPLPVGTVNNANQLRVAAVPNVTFTPSCGTPTITANPNANTFSVSNGTVPARDGGGTGPNYGVCTITLDVTGPADSYTDIITGGAGGEVSSTALLADGVTTRNVYPSVTPVTATVTFTSSLGASKSFLPSAIASGGTSRVTITLENPGSTTLTNVSVTDPFPTDMVLGTPADIQTSCSTANTPTSTTSSVSLTGVTLAPGANCTLQFNVKATGSSSWVNTIPGGGITADGGVSKVTPTTATLNNTGIASVQINPTVSNPSINQPGVPVTLNIPITAPAGSALTNLGFTTYFRTPNGLSTDALSSVVVATNPNYTTDCVNGSISASPLATSFSVSGISLAAGASCTVYIDVTMQQAVSTNIVIAAGAVTTDQNITNNNPGSTTLSTLQALGVFKSFNPTIIKPGQTSTMTITVFNAKDTPLGGVTNISLTDNLPTTGGPDNNPGNMTLASSSFGTQTCTPITSSNLTVGGNSVVVSGFNLAAASGGVATTCTMTTQVTATALGQYTNNIAVGGVTGNSGGASNPLKVSAILQVRLPVQIEKSFSSPITLPGVPVTATVTIKNPDNAIALTQAVLEDTLPSGLSIAPTPNASTTCGSGNVSAPAGFNKVKLTSGTIPASGQCTITFDVVANAPATYTNTIPANALSTLIGVTNEDPASAQVTVPSQPSVSKVFDPASIPANGTSTLTITVTNPNSAIATLTSDMVDTLPTSPAAITVAPTPNIGGTCDNSKIVAVGGTVTLQSGATVPANSSCTIIVDVTGSVDGTYQNTILTGGLVTDKGNNLQPANATLVISPLGSISGKVFLDLNGDGVFNGSDTPISGQTIELSGDATDTKITNASGNYQFTGLSAGTYIVTQPSQPAGTLNGTITPGSGANTTPGTQSTPGGTSGRISNIVLTAGVGGVVGSSSGNNFAEVQNNTASISGHVYVDANNNNQFDAGEGLVGVPVKLIGNKNGGGAVGAPDQVSGVDGLYTFSNLPPSDSTGYTIFEVQPSSHLDGQNQAPTGTASNGKPIMSGGNDNITGVVVTAGATLTNYNFGELANYTVSGRVFVDANSNTTYDAGEELVGVPVTLAGNNIYNTDIGTGFSVVTQADGAYTFTNVPKSDNTGYRITETQPANPDGTNQIPGGNGSSTSSKPVATNGADEISGVKVTTASLSGYNFIELPNNTASLSGYVYVDANQNNQYDTGEGLAGQSVKLTTSTGAAVAGGAAQLTGMDGSYSFTGLAASDANGYTVVETQPTAYYDGTNQAPTGTAATGKPIASSAEDKITGVVINNGDTLVNYNFGELPNFTITGTVFVDTNNDGVIDLGETDRLGGVPIRLTGTSTGGSTVTINVTSDNTTGVYTFTVPPGTYSIIETQPGTNADGKTLPPTGTAAGTKPFAAGADDRIDNVVVTNASLTGYNFAELPATGISGKVYADLDNSGTFNTGDMPIVGVTVTLRGNNASNVAITPIVVTTQSDGSYSFPNVPPSDLSGYTIEQTQPPAYYTDGETTKAVGNPGNAPASSKPVSPGNLDTITGVVLGGTALTDYNFGEVPNLSISGTVYVDADNSNTINGTEATTGGIPNVEVTLTGKNASGIDIVPITVTTGPNGTYSFTGLMPSNGSGYTIAEKQPANPDGQNAIPGGNGAQGPGKPIATNGSDQITGVVLSTTSLTGYNFGELQTNSISGIVYIDTNNNGVIDTGETQRLGGVPIKLTGKDINGTDIGVGGGGITTTTQPDGTYSFTGLLPSNGAGYTITQTQPSTNKDGKSTTSGNPGTVDTTTIAAGADDVITGVTLNGTALAGYNFGELPSVSISGRVFLDLNNDGVIDSGETTGIPNIDITLTGNDITGTPITVTVQTAANGDYSFPNLPPSDGTGYKITEGTVTGYLDGLTKKTPSGNPGNEPTKPLSGGALDEYTLVVLQGTALTGYNFAERPNNGTIAGRVYVDLNDNGLIDSGEPGIVGVVVKLTGNTQAGPAVSVPDVTTDANGNYSFSNVPQSDATGYTITETQPGDYTDGKTTVTTPPGTAPTKPLTGSNPDAITGVVMPVGGALTGYNFGERYKGVISGVVYIDLNDNGVQDAGEPGIPGVTMALSGNTLAGNAVGVSPVSTDASGAYSFTGLPPSDATGYTVGETQPTAYRDGKTTAPTGTTATGKPLAAGAADLITGVVLANGQARTGYNFGELAGSISGKVYIDANDNGVAEPEEAPLAGVTVKLTGTDNEGATVEKTVVTAADGTYSFTGLKNSNPTGYTITETQPADNDGKTTAPTGTASSTKPVATGQPDVIGGVVLSGGAALTGYNFGERRTTSTISGFVYNDLNNNGVKDTAETGVSGVIVTLTGVSSTNQPVSLTRTTGADGSFSFTDVPPSNSAGYVLAEAQPTGFTDGKNTIKSGNPGAQIGTKPTNTEDLDRIGTIVVPVSPVQYTDYLFGEIPLPSLLPPIVNGYVYLDKDHNRIRPRDGTVKGMAGWTVVLSQNGTTICTTTTADNGFYQFDNLHCPGFEQSGLPTGTGFKITFSKDGSNLPAVPQSGGDRGTVPDTGGVIENITLNPSDRVVEQNLPLDPAGVIYDSVTRQPIPGARITITGPPGFNPAVHLVGGLNALNQTVGADGFYQYLLQNNFPNGTYTLVVTSPEGYLPAPSTTLPACQGGALPVGALPRPALIQASDGAPALSVPLHDPANCQGLIPGGVNTTQYYFQFVITNTSADILNNHIPLDPIINNGVFVTKTTPLVTVSRGGLVPYTITVTNPLSAPLTNVKVRDQLPAGFQYRKGSATQDGAPANVNVTPNGFVEWPAENFTANQKKVYKLILIVGAGVGDGDYSNRAWMANAANDNQISNTAIATVRITPDPTLDCPEIIGRVFNDKNANGYDDDGEEGIPGVRMATPNGLLVTTDAEGRFHVPCPAIPNPDRGSNFVMKLDERTLPSGFRVTTENPRDVRLTRGKMAKLNFGATIHHVVRIELSDQAFQPGSTELLPEYRRQVDNLPTLLAAKPSVVRLAYIRGTDPQLSKQRIAAVRSLLDGLWKQVKGRYGLTIEIEGEK